MANSSRRSHQKRWIAPASEAWRLLIGGWHEERPISSRFVVHAKNAADAVTLFRRRGIQGVNEKGVERYPCGDR